MMGKCSALQRIWKMLLILAAGILAGTFLLLGVYLLPTEPINRHVEASVPLFQKGGTYPNVTPYWASRLDNWTDSIMLLTAAYEGPEGLLDRAMGSYYKRTEGLNPQESLVSQYGENGKDPEDTYVISYGRYWHGYLVFLKPLLLFFDYGGIRMVNLLLQTGVNLYLMFLLYRKNQKRYIFPYVLTVLLLMPLTTAWSLQFSSVFYLFAAGLIVMIRYQDQWKRGEPYFYYFLILGMLTSYFDFLTYPLATFGIPAVMYVCLNREALKTEIFKGIGFGLSWAMGYVGMWAGKWLIGSLFTGSDLVSDAMNSVSIRTSGGSEEVAFSTLEMLGKNVTTFLDNPLIWVGFFFILLLLILGLIKGDRRTLRRDLIVFGGISLLPFIWYLGTGNHSYMHFWFTYKELCITAFAWLCLAVHWLPGKGAAERFGKGVKR